MYKPMQSRPIRKKSHVRMAGTGLASGSVTAQPMVSVLYEVKGKASTENSDPRTRIMWIGIYVITIFRSGWRSRSRCIIPCHSNMLCPRADSTVGLMWLWRYRWIFTMMAD